MLFGLVDSGASGAPTGPFRTLWGEGVFPGPLRFGEGSQAHRALSRQPLLWQDPHCQYPLAAPILLSKEKESQSWDNETYLFQPLVAKPPWPVLSGCRVSLGSRRGSQAWGRQRVPSLATCFQQGSQWIFPFHRLSVLMLPVPSGRLRQTGWGMSLVGLLLLLDWEMKKPDAGCLLQLCPAPQKPCCRLVPPVLASLTNLLLSFSLLEFSSGFRFITVLSGKSRWKLPGHFDFWIWSFHFPQIRGWEVARKMSNS